MKQVFLASVFQSWHIFKISFGNGGLGGGTRHQEELFQCNVASEASRTGRVEVGGLQWLPLHRGEQTPVPERGS